jgi:hypothetical protein
MAIHNHEHVWSDKRLSKVHITSHDPVGFLESSIVEKYGKSGLDVWKKSQEFSEKLALLSEADKTAAESAFSNFLKSA